MRTTLGLLLDLAALSSTPHAQTVRLVPTAMVGARLIEDVGDTEFLVDEQMGQVPVRH